MGDQYYELVSNLYSPSKLHRTKAAEILNQGPHLSASEEWYILAFDEISFDRPIAAGASGAISLAIPLSTFLAYAHHLNLEQDKRDIFLKIMRLIDNAERRAANQG